MSITNQRDRYIKIHIYTSDIDRLTLYFFRVEGLTPMCKKPN